MVSVTVQKVSTQTVYHRLAKYHDLWIVLAWGGILAGIFLNTYFNRDCYAFTTQGFGTATCQTSLDLGLVFLAGLGAGMTIRDTRIGVVGFLLAHVTATGIFFIAVILPPLTGATNSVLLDTFIVKAILLGILYSFPIALFLSLVGSLFGMFIGGKIPGSKIWGRGIDDEESVS